MPLSEEDQAIYKSVRPKLIGIADPMVLLPFLTDVLEDADVVLIQNKYQQYGRNNGMMELMTIYERKAPNLQPLKHALSCSKIDFDQTLASGQAGAQPETTQELLEAFYKLQAIEQQVTTLVGELHLQVKEEQQKMFKQTEEQCSLQNKLTEVHKESQQSLADFQHELDNHEKTQKTLNQNLRKVEKDFQEEIIKLQEDQSDKGSKLWQSLGETMRRYQQLQTNIGQLNIQMEQNSSDFGANIQSQLANQNKIQSRVEKLDAELKNQGELQEELKTKMEEVHQNLVDVDKVVDDKMQQQILALYDEIHEFQDKIENDKKSEKKLIESQIVQTQTEMVHKIAQEINDAKHDVMQRQTESLNSMQNQITANIDAKTNELRSEIPSLTQINIGLQQIRQDMESHDKEIVQRLSKEEETRFAELESVRYQLGQTETKLSEQHQQVQKVEQNMGELETQISQIHAEIVSKTAQEINNVKDDVIKQQAESLNAFQSQVTTDVNAKTDELKSEIQSLTPLIDRSTKMENSLQQIRQDIDAYNSEIAQRLSLEEESRLESIRQQDNEMKSQVAEITSNTDTIKTEMDQRLKDANTKMSEYQIQLETEGKQLEQMRQDFDDFELLDKSIREPLQSSILLIGGETKRNDEIIGLDSLEMYFPYNPCLNRLLDCKLKIARSGPVSALLSNQQVYVAGGLADKYFNTMEIFDPLLQIRISDGPPMSIIRLVASAVTLHDRLVVFGGLEQSGKPLNSVEVFSPHTNRWSPFINMQHTRCSHSAVELDGKVYLIGGRVNGNDSRHISPSVSILDVASHTWTEKEMKEKRSSAASAIIDGSIIVNGGWNGSSWLSICERFDPREGEWRKIGDMKEKKEGHALVNFKGKLIAIGGYDGTKSLDTVEEYDSRMNTWNTVETTLKEPKNFLSGVIL